MKKVYIMNAFFLFKWNANMVHVLFVVRLMAPRAIKNSHGIVCSLKATHL